MHDARDREVRSQAMSKTALVTGASRGIGRALVERLSELGVSVYATARDEAALATLRDRTGCFGAPFDLANPSAPRALYLDAREVLRGPPDILINNAGFNSRKARFVEVSDAEVERQFAVNLRAPLLLCREALRDMSERAPDAHGARGHIVNVISSVVHRGIEAMGVYSAMKHGLHGATKVLVKEARAVGVKVTAVYPGGTDSAFREESRPDYMTAVSVARVISDVVFSPEDVVIHEITFRPMVEDNF